MASFGVSTASTFLTDVNESGSNPPPTISDDMSTKDDLSVFSVLSTKFSVNRKILYHHSSSINSYDRKYSDEISVR